MAVLALLILGAALLIALLLVGSGRLGRERLVVVSDSSTCQAAKDQGAGDEQDAEAAEAVEKVRHQVTPLPTPALGAMVDM